MWTVSVVPDYWLMTGVRSPWEAEDFFSSLCIHTSSEAHPASCTGGPFPGVKCSRGMMLTIHPQWNEAVLGLHIAIVIYINQMFIWVMLLVSD
jgi:hypothetical protein